MGGPADAPPRALIGPPHLPPTGLFSGPAVRVRPAYGCEMLHCNVKCRYCEYWRLKHYVQEMTIEEWQSALKSIKEFVGTFSINFSGGEPFIKPGFIDLLGWCHRNGISAGVT